MAGVRRGVHGRGGPRIVAALAVAAVIACAGTTAATASGGFPVPTCGWVSTGQIKTFFGVRVRALNGVWRTSFAPVLTCRYLERRPKLQFGNVPIVAVQYRELQRFNPGPQAKPVKRLGSCVEHSSCPKPHQPAWIITQQGTTGPKPNAPYGLPYVSGVTLGVEDGLNALVIQVANPDGPLPVKNEVAQVEALARKLLPKFRWK